MSPLRQRMLEDMQLRGLSARTGGPGFGADRPFRFLIVTEERHEPKKEPAKGTNDRSAR